MVTRFLHLIAFLKNNRVTYFISVNIVIFITILLTFLLIFLSFKIKKKPLKFLWPVKLLRFGLPLFTNTLFGPFFLLESTIFDCTNGGTYVDSKLRCRTGKWYAIDGPLAGIAMGLMCFLTLLNSSLYYIPTFIKKGNDYIKKSSSLPLVFFQLTKMAIIILFISDKAEESEHWAVLSILIFFTGLNAYITISFDTRENKILQKIDNALSLMLVWMFLSLFIGNIFKSWEFNGSIFLVIIGMIIIIVFNYYYLVKVYNYLDIDFNEINSSKDFITYINFYINIIESKDKLRDSDLIFRSIVDKIEQKCKDNNCYLKKYLESLEKGVDSNFLLYKHIQNLFELALAKLPNDIDLRINYIIYLAFKMNKKKQAKIELSKFEEDTISFEGNFNVYRCKKLMEDYFSYSYKSREEGIDNIDVLEALEYKKYANDFKELLTNISSLYYKFWSTLLDSHFQGSEDFQKLNDIGVKINQSLTKIEESFIKLQQIKNNDTQIIKLYMGFAKEILNDINKYKNYREILINIYLENNVENKDIDYINFDLSLIHESDEHQCLIISAQDENLGIIVQMSISLCSIFGYTKNEIIGKNISFLIPHIYQDIHENIVKQITEETKTKLYEKLSKKLKYKPEYIEKIIYCKTKSKFIIPIAAKIFFIQTEDNSQYYIVEITRKYSSPNKILNKLTNETNVYNDKLNIDIRNELDCIVLTDTNFFIQTFTPNAKSYLGLTSDIINSNFSINSFIKEIQDEFNTEFHHSNVFDGQNNLTSSEIYFLNNENPNYIPEIQKIELAKTIYKSKYSSPKIINWKIYEGDIKSSTKYFGSFINESKINQKRLSGSHCIFNQKMKSNKKVNFTGTKSKRGELIFEQNIFMEAKEIFLMNESIGFKFMFYKNYKEEENNNNVVNTINPNQKKNRKSFNINFNFITSGYNSGFGSKFDSNFNSGFGSYISSDTNSKIEDYQKTQSLFSMNKIPTNSKDNKEVANKQYFKSTSGNSNSSNLVKKVIIQDEDESDDIPFSSSSDRKICKITNNEKYKNFKLEGKNKFELNKKLVPSCNFNFEFDGNSMSFVPRYTVNKDEDPLSELLKKESLSKIEVYKNQIKNKKALLENDSSNSYSDSSESYESEEEEYESEEKSEITVGKKTSPRLTKNLNQVSIQNAIPSSGSDRKNINPLHSTKLKNKQNTFNLSYYKVNLNKIRFQIFDFNREMIIDKSFDKISQVEHAFKSDVNHIVNTSLFNPNSSQIGKLRSKKSVMEGKPKDIMQNDYQDNTKIIATNFGKIDKEKELEKEIKDVLSREDEQETIFRFSLVSIICLLILLAIGGIGLYFFSNSIKNIKKNFEILKNTSNLRYHTAVGIFSIRELTLLNMQISGINGSEYINIPLTNKENYTLYIKSQAAQIFNLCHELVDNIISTNLKFTKETNYILNEKPFITKILMSNYSTKIMNTTIIVAMTQINAAFFNLISNIDSITQKNVDVYAYIHNSLNNMSEGIKTEIELYNNELQIRGNNINKITKISEIMVFIIFAIIWIVIIICYLSVIKKKSSYIDVFYGIGINLIKDCALKCEYYLNQIKQQEKIIEKKYSDQGNEITTLSSLSKIPYGNDFLKDKIEKVKKNNIENLSRNNKSKESSQTKNFKIFFTSFFICLFIYIFFTCFAFIKLINKIKSYSQYIYYLQKCHNSLLDYFNIYREYLFDNGTIINNEKIYDYLVDYEQYIFNNKNDDEKYLTIKRKKILNLTKVMNEISKQSLCSFNKAVNESECLNSFYGSATYGYKTFTSFYIEKLREYRNDVKYLLDNELIRGNLTRYGREIWTNDNLFNSPGLVNDTQPIFRLDLFNDNEKHYELNTMFVSVILPYIDTVRSLTMNIITNSFATKENTYIILLILYMILIFTLFVVYWLPKIKSLNIEIFKTKNMLAIIPLNILASQNQIITLLNIKQT